MSARAIPAPIAIAQTTNAAAARRNPHLSKFLQIDATTLHEIACRTGPCALNLPLRKGAPDGLVRAARWVSKGVLCFFVWWNSLAHSSIERIARNPFAVNPAPRFMTGIHRALQILSTHAAR